MSMHFMLTLLLEIQNTLRRGKIYPACNDLDFFFFKVSINSLQQKLE